ncbi:MAG: translation elongation factor Ts [Sphaerochaetaceae bacterium]|jgi:elongation factor Ts|nr:translation elongation factor Ts [Sphaerochaetaceae bacterium]
MATITAQMVKQLREATGAGMMDCKNALVKANGDFAEADKILKEMGKAAVAKRQDRPTENGRISIKQNGKAVAMVSVSCETDFVSSNEKFAALGNELCDMVLANAYTEPNDALTAKVNEAIAIIKENMAVRNVYYKALADSQYAATYIHGDGAMGVVVVFQADNAEAFQKDAVKEFTNDVALHVAAFTPSHLSMKDVPEQYVNEQLEIFRAQVKDMDKPEKVKEGIVRGKLNKHLGEICLLSQNFVKDETMSVEKKMAAVSKENGCKLSIVDYKFFVAGTK